MRHRILAGAAAGAVGTTALNAVTFLDMAVRARPAGSTPEDTVRKSEDVTGMALSKQGLDSDQANNRRSALGSLLGIAAGLGTGPSTASCGRQAPPPRWHYWVGAGLAANIGTTGPMAAAGITDVRSWSADSWLSDLVPHLAYGFATAGAWELMRGRQD